MGQNLATGLTTGRTLRLANLSTERVAEVAARNLDDLAKILEWNVEHDIRCFRIGSSVIPFASHPDFEFDWAGHFTEELERIRSFAQEHEVRLSMHPGQYTVLNSPHERVVENSIAELEFHAEFLSLVAPRDGTMTLHVGGAYGDREAAVERFGRNFERLSQRARERLVLENDDTTFDIADVLHLCSQLELPAVFDFFHHRCLYRAGDVRQDLIALLGEVVASWKGAPPKFHLSSAREAGLTAHADYLQTRDLLDAIGALGEVADDEPFDLVLEAKAKDGAVLEAMKTLEAVGAV